jgi:hypothetical protein
MKIYPVLVIALALAPWSAGAQLATTPAPSVDGRWAPWLGCWEPDRASPSARGVRVCIGADGPRGVKVLTLQDASVAAEESIVADGAAHPAADHDCRGTAVTEWARQRTGLYRRSELTCGQQGARTVHDLWFVASDRTWVEVTVRDDHGQRSVRIRRHQPAVDQSLPEGIALGLPPTKAFLAALHAAGAPWTVAAVIEANARLPREGVQAAVAEAGEPFALDAKSLVQLSDAGVDSSIIDLMVALTYPRRFEVRYASGGSRGWIDADDWFFAPMYGFYGVWGYPYYPYDDGGWVPIDPGGGSGSVEPARQGKVVKGFGYTQVAVRDNSPARGGTPASGDGSSSSSGSSGNQGSQASPQGYSGGSGAGSDRTAQPRGPGDQL